MPPVVPLARALIKPTSLIATVAALGGFALMFAPPFSGDIVLRAAGLTIFAIGLWAAGTFPPGITAIAFFALAILSRAQPPAVVFSGFDSSALWMVFGGMVMGVCVTHTGLGERIAKSLARGMSSSYFGILSVIALAALLLSFLIPSTMSRVVLLVPVIAILAQRLGFGPGSRGRTAMVMTFVLVTFSAGGAILPALMPSMVLAGMAETLYGAPFTYGGFLFIHFPVLGLVKAALFVGLIGGIWRDDPKPVAVDTSASPPFSTQEKMASVIMGGSLLLWMTDSWHGVNPAWVALAASALMLIPSLNLLPPRSLNEKLDWSMFLYTAAALSLGTIAAKSGLSDRAGHALLAHLPIVPNADFTNFMSLSLLSSLIGLIVTNPGVPAVLSPLAQDMAAATSMPLLSVLMTEPVGFLNVFLPYYASPVLVGIQMGGVKFSEGTKVCLVTAFVIVLLLLPLDYLWWRAIGMF
jgi:di/tricarboxylate transporter